MREQGAKILIRPRDFNAQPVFNPLSDRRCHPEMPSCILWWWWL